MKLFKIGKFLTVQEYDDAEFGPTILLTSSTVYDETPNVFIVDGKEVGTLADSVSIRISPMGAVRLSEALLKTYKQIDHADQANRLAIAQAKAAKKSKSIKKSRGRVSS